MGPGQSRPQFHMRRLQAKNPTTKHHNRQSNMGLHCVEDTTLASQDTMLVTRHTTNGDPRAQDGGRMETHPSLAPAPSGVALEQLCPHEDRPG